MAVVADRPAGSAIRRRLPGALLAGLCVLILSTHVHTGFERIRVRVMTEPVRADGGVLSLALPDLSPLARSPAAVVLRLRGGSEPARVRAALDGVPIADLELPPGREVRIDASVTVQGGIGHRLEIAGDRGGWSATYLEIANVFGFTRGLVSFDIVPRGLRGFPKLSAFWLAAVFFALLAIAPSSDWPSGARARRAHRAASAFVLILFLAVFAADLFTQFKILLSAATFLLCLAIVYAQRTLRVAELLTLALVWIARTVWTAGVAAVRLFVRAAAWQHARAAAAASLAVAVAIVAFVFGSHVAGGADSSGYVSQAEWWANGRLALPQPIVADLPRGMTEWVAMPLGYVPHTSSGVRGQIVPSYPPGLPLTMAAFRLIGGPGAVFLVVPLLAGLAVWLTFVLGRRVYGDSVGLFGAGWLAASPAFIVAMFNPMSDVPVTAWWLCALVAAARPTLPSASIAGVATSLAVVTRPNLVPLAAIVALPFLRGARRQPLPLVVFCLAGAPGAALVGILFDYWYGLPLKSGYGSFDYLYSWSAVIPNLQRYPVWFAVTQTPFAFIGLAAPFLLSRQFGFTLLDRKRLSWTLLAFAALVWVLYLPYFPFDAWEYLRFVLPSYPILLVLAGVTCAVLTRATVAGRWLMGALFVFLIGWGLQYARNGGALDIAAGEARYERVGTFAGRELPERAVLISMQHSGSVRFYGHRTTLRYDAVPDGRLDELVAHLRARGYDPYFVLDEWERDEFRKRFAAQNALGALDWKPAAETRTPVRVYVYDPRDRDRTDAVSTRAIE